MFAANELIKGHPWGSDVLLLIAVILFFAAAVIRYAVRAWDVAFVATGLAALALALLIL